ncbi:alpha/beta fold hydrolase [Tomitella biformata]|uniref:alpha/beta fold hydrolase n=1 Tax=Tomitella biformata TaxID=630403 RepID=UPI000467E63C|nr:alpha/beta hydrolase [Tomitella biformata]
MNDGFEMIAREPGVELAVKRSGSGPAVLLIGGLGMPSLVWDICGLAEALIAEGFSVISYNARGMAPSSAPAAPYSIAGLAEDATAILDHFEVADAIVVAYSMGCYIAQTLLRESPERVRATVLFAGLQPTPFNSIVGEMELGLIEKYGEVPHEVLVFEQLVTTLHPAMLQDPVMVQNWRDLLAAGSGGWAGPEGFKGQLAASQEWLGAGEPMPERLAEIAVPTLVLAFEHDLFFPPAQSEATARLIPQAEFAQIDGVGHGGLFTGPGDSVARIAKFCVEQGK